MAETDEAAAADPVTSFEKYDVDTLKAIRQNLIGGIDRVGQRLEFEDDKIIGMGTALVRPKDGAATPIEAGQGIVMLFDTITRELRKRGALK